MTHWKRALCCAALTGLGLFGTACLFSGGSDEAPEPTPTLESAVQAMRTVTVSTPTATPFPTVLPVLPLLSTYTVQPGDSPLLIAESAGVPGPERDAWVNQMLMLNNTDAYSLQVGQQLILPPMANGSVPMVSSNVAPSNSGAPSIGGSTGEGPAPPSFPITLVQPISSVTPAPQGTAAAPGGVPFAPTPPFVAFTSPTATPTATRTPSPSPTPSQTPTPTPYPAGARAWLTSAEVNAQYYYCDFDSGWRSIPVEKLLAFDSEQELLAIWGRFRVKAPESVC